MSMYANTTQDTLDELIDWIRNHYFGKYRGTVTDNADPTGRGRLKVKVPAVLGEVDAWAMPCVPYAGAGVGFYSLPDVGTGVWVEFEGGDKSYPVWSGFFWGDGELPDDNDANIKIWKTAAITIRIDDAAQEVVIETASGATLTLSDAVVTEAGSGIHTVGSDGVVSEAGGTKASVSATSFSVNDGALEVM